MPVLTVSTPKYRRHKTSGQAVVTIQSKDHYFLGPHGTKASRIEYDRLVGEWLAAGRPAAPSAPQSDITVMELAAGFLRYAKQRYRKHGRPTGTADNFKPILAMLRTKYGHTRAADFGALALKAIQYALIQEGQSRRYINDNIQRICQIFRWAASEQLISPLVHQGLATVDSLRKDVSGARETEPIQPVDDDVVEATLALLGGRHGPSAAPHGRVTRRNHFASTGRRRPETGRLAVCAQRAQDRAPWAPPQHFYRPEGPDIFTSLPASRCRGILFSTG